MRNLLSSMYKMFIMAVAYGKRKQRRAELRHHIQMIRNPRGCEDVTSRYVKCVHIVNHYKISLESAGVSCISQLKIEVEASRARRQEHERKMKRLCECMGGARNVKDSVIGTNDACYGYE